MRGPLADPEAPVTLIEGQTGMGKSTVARGMAENCGVKCSVIRCEKENITAFRDAERLLAPLGIDLHAYTSGDIIGLMVTNRSAIVAGSHWKGSADMDTDILAGMIDAVRMFVRDSVGAAGDDPGAIDVIGYGSSTIMTKAISNGYVIAVVHGIPSFSARSFLERLSADVEERFSRALADWHGSGGTIRELDDFLAERGGNTALFGGLASRGEMTAAVIEHLRSMAPVLLIVDDMHWIDPSSLELMEGVVNARIDGVRFVGLYNPDYARRHPAFMRFVEDHRDAVVVLPPMGVDDLVELIEERYGPVSWARTLAEVLEGRTGGVPLLAVEYLSAMEADGIIRKRGGRYTLHSEELYEWRAPGSLEAVVEEKISSLPPDVRSVLRAASVIGDAVNFETLARVLEMSEVKLAMAVEAAEEAGVVESTEEGFKFNHRLYRNALYSSLKGYQRRAYHGAVARVLEEMRGDVEDIAYHYYLAGKGDKALPFIRAAVERAERLHSMLEMRKLASMGAEVAREAEDLFYFLIRKAGAENVTGKVEAAERDAREALRYATTPAQRLEVFKTIASTYMRQGLYKKVLDLIEEFRDSVGEEGAFHLDMQRATVLMKFGDVQGAISLVEPHLTTDLTEKERIYLYRFYGILRSYVGDDKGAEEYYLRSLEIAERIGDLAGMSAACNNVAIIYVGRGDVVKGKEYYERALEYERAMNDLRGMSLVMINLAELLTSQGEYEKALSMFAEIMDIKERIHDLEGLGFARHGLLYTNMLLGRYPEAEEHGREALTTFEDIGFTAGRCFVRVTLSLLHSVRGEDDRAVEMAREALLLAEEMRDEEMIRSARFRLKAAGVWRGERTEDLSDGEIEGEDDALLLYVAGLKGSGKAVEALEEALSSGKPLNPDLRRFTAGLASLLKGDWEGFQSALSSMNSPYYAALLRRAEGLMR